MTMADRISTLPDSILCHILSFLPTEQAVATSLLSKRWKPLWLAVPTLNFDDERYSLKNIHANMYTYLRFLQLVYSVFLFRDGEQSIKKFSLKCVDPFCTSSILNTWVKAATQRKVEHLSLSLSHASLPPCVLTSKTLVVLKLSGLTVDSFSSVSFPSLKILHLSTVRFQEKRYLVEILSACPVLEVLLINYVHFPNSIRAQISELKLLPKLVKADISLLDLPLKAFYNVEFLRVRVLLSKPDLHAHNFPNLTYMELTFVDYYWDWLIKLLSYCPSLQNLVIDKAYSIEVCPADENWVHPQVVPECVLSQLKRLRVSRYRGKECELQFTRYIIKNAKVLRKVTICGTSSSDPQKKLQMIKQLSLCPRGSVACELYFE